MSLVVKPKLPPTEYDPSSSFQVHPTCVPTGLSFCSCLRTFVLALGPAGVPFPLTFPSLA